MIETVCNCGQAFSARAPAVGQTVICSKCNAPIHVVSAEAMTEEMGAGDFDARLVVEKGPQGDKVGMIYLLGGVEAIAVGKLAASHILLPGTMVSRHHATLNRVDFGPSRWQLADEQSTNGLWVNDERVEKHELKDGDLIVIGEYELRYMVAQEPVAAPAIVAAPTAGKTRNCPSCGKSYSDKKKICVECGIYLDTGKPLITAKGFDENDLFVKAENVIRVFSWFSWLGIYPVASEGFGTFKPIALWTIAGLTTLITLIAFVADAGTNKLTQLAPTAGYQLWAGDPNLHIDISKLSAARHASRDQIAMAQQMLDNRPKGEVHWYQFLTHAFLHGGFMHLGGNMLFLIILGVPVNNLIGNVKTAIIYPVLAIAAGMAHFAASRHHPMMPMVGASGAIMGLAGMYLVLFPIHKMYMAAWIRWGIIGGFRLSWKIWALRGFWVVLFYISFDVIFTLLGVHDSTAHWAHMGGFMAGVATALLLLITRQVNARGGDLLSVTLGRHAWAILGKPSQWNAAPAEPPARAIVLG